MNRTAAAVAALGAAALMQRSRGRAAQGMDGWLASRLATWIPATPATPVGRIAARVWAAPITLAGLLAGAASGAPPRLWHGVVLFAPARSLTGLLVRVRGFAAAGLGHVVISLDEPTPQLLAHELVHVRQAERLGPLMAPLYLTLLAVHGYTRHPMERAARLGATTATVP